MKTQVIVKTVLGNVVAVGETKRDCTKFSVRNDLKTRMQLKHGPSVSVEFVVIG